MPVAEQQRTGADVYLAAVVRGEDLEEDLSTYTARFDTQATPLPVLKKKTAKAN